MSGNFFFRGIFIFIFDGLGVLPPRLADGMGFFSSFDKGEGLYQLVLHQLQCLILEASFHFDL